MVPTTPSIKVAWAIASVASTFACLGAPSNSPDYETWVRTEEIAPLKARCDQHDAVACLDLLEARDAAEIWTAESRQRKLDLGKRACELGQPDGCAYAAIAFAIMTYGSRTERQQMEYANMLHGACASGSYEACSLIHLTQEVPERYPSAEAAFRNVLASCNRRARKNCDVLATMMIVGHGTPPAVAEGIGLLRRSCLHDAWSCHVLASILANGRLLPLDTAQAVQLCIKIGERDVNLCPGSFAQQVARVLDPVRVPVTTEH
jgi:hypothetical protein